MAYNLQPLITILQGILDPDQSRCIVDENNPQLQSLLHKAISLQQLLDSKSSVTKLDSQIREVAHQAEDIIESHMVHHMLSGSDCVRFTLSTPDLQQITRELDSVMEQAEKLMEMDDKMMPSSSSSSVVVGIDEGLMQLEKKLEIVPIVGTGGKLNEDPLIVSHFAYRTWNCNMPQILKSVVRCITGQECEQAEKLVEMEDKKMLSSSSSSPVVGIDEDLMQLKDRLIGQQQKKLEIVPIVGMGGIGKTTLAQKLYEDKLIVDCFDCRAWATVSQDYNMTQILKSLLHCIIKREEFYQHKEMHELKDILYKSLYGRKYLIVLDDIWSTKFWDEIRMYFLDNNNGSRIVITTRESVVASYADSSRSYHQVQLLGESESWNLLRQFVFGQDDCSIVLQAIGLKIASDCGGLPLAISVIGGLLSKMGESEDGWRKIGDNVIAAIAESDERCYGILSLSYNELPNHLKPCFLYMGAFPEDYEIERSRLVSLWVAEGFVKSNGGRSLEEEAEDWLKSLIERNLFMIRKYNKDGKPKSYIMHDMLRELCIRKSDEDKFMYMKYHPKVTFSNSRRVSFIRSNGMEDVDDLEEYMPLIRTVICKDNDSQSLEHPSRFFFASTFLRVLDLLGVWFKEFPTEIFEFVNLRFLGVDCTSSIPRGISRLQNLQTLIGYIWFDVASELWQLSELRNLKVAGLELLEDEEMNYSVLKKLQIISTTTLNASTWDGFFKSIPNIQKLAINDEFRSASKAIDLSDLHKLEILKCHRIRSLSFPDGSDWGFNVIFPCNIKKLALYQCRVKSGVWRTLCALQKLEALTLHSCTFESEEETGEEEWEIEETSEEVWKLADGDVFSSLQVLNLQSLNLGRWIADETNFPRLRHLRLQNCQCLEEIPSGIGEIPTLQLIELRYCSESAEASVERIVKEQQSDYDNYDLKLSISNSSGHGSIYH